jgi:hypothetical protein
VCVCISYTLLFRMNILFEVVESIIIYPWLPVGCLGKL